MSFLFIHQKKYAIIASTITFNLVMILLIQGCNRIFQNSSITIFPDKVPVSVEFFPDARRAIANNISAKLSP